MVDSSLIPVKHGAEIPFQCPWDYIKQDATVSAVCQNGDIVFSPGGVSSCTKLGKYLHTYMRIAAFSYLEVT